MSPEEVRWVAHLARLELAEDELPDITRQLSAIIDYVNQLQKLNTDGVEPLAHALDVHNIFREDEPAPALPWMRPWPTRQRVKGTSTASRPFWINDV